MTIFISVSVTAYNNAAFGLSMERNNGKVTSLGAWLPQLELSTISILPMHCLTEECQNLKRVICSFTFTRKTPAHAFAYLYSKHQTNICRREWEMGEGRVGILNELIRFIFQVGRDVTADS